MQRLLGNFLRTLQISGLLVVAAITSGYSLSFMVSQKAFALNGGGTAESPYQVSSCADFLDIENDLDAYYVLTTSIDCSANGDSITIGDDVLAFMGSFDGNHKSITIDIDNTNYPNDVAGLFNYLGGTVHDLDIYGSITTDVSTGALAGYAEFSNIDNVQVYADVQGGNVTGGLIGETSNVAISNILVTGDVTGNNYLGGIIGKQVISSLTDGIFKGAVTSTGTYVGGIVGGNLDSNVTRVSSSGTVQGNASAGGLFGIAESATTNTARLSYSTSTVNATNNTAGGLVGELAGGFEIEDSYARGDVTAANSVGGIAGSATANTISRVYATGLVTATSGSEIGGLLGLDMVSGVTIADSFWDVRGGANLLTTAGSTIIGAVENQSATAMKLYPLYSTNPTLSTSWDFNTIWGMNGTDNDGYPFLLWQGWASDPPRDSDTTRSSIEDAAPNDGDGNNDGIPDAEQSNVVSFVNTVSNTYITVAIDADSGCTFMSTATTDGTSHATKDIGFTYPSGFLNFTANCPILGTVADIQVYFYGVNTATSPVPRKYNPSTGAYFTIPEATSTKQTIGGEVAWVATYQIIEGGVLDVDGVTNGIITDPVGLGVAAIGIPNTGLGRQH